MKQKLLCFFLLLSIYVHSQDKPFTSLKFDKVVLYDYRSGMPKGEGELSIVDKNGKLNKSVTKQIILDNKTASELSKKLENKASYGAGTYSCFDPHLGVVYYLKNKVVAHVSICMSCNNLIASTKIVAQDQWKTDAKLKTKYRVDGLSDSFRNYLNGLLKKYKFSHQIKS